MISSDIIKTMSNRSDYNENINSFNDKIVVTGMGLVCPLSRYDDENVSQVFDRLMKGESGIRKIQKFNVQGAAGYCSIAGELDELPLENIMTPAELRRNGRFIHHAVLAASRALKSAGLCDDVIAANYQQFNKERAAVIIGSGIGGIDEMYHASLALSENRRLSPFFVPSCLINLAASVISIKFGLKGATKAVVTACASGAHSIIEAYYMLKNNHADVVLAGGAEGSICRLGMEGFAAMNALASGFNDHPTKGSRPYDCARSGFVMGEGAGVLVLERLEHALARGAKIYASLEGFGASADADHITTPNYMGAVASIEQALEMAKVDSVGHINAHATSTPAGDASELKAFKHVFGEKLLGIPITANKGSIGHLLGAAGGVEAIFTIMSLQSNIVPPTLNLEHLDPQAYINDQPFLIKNEVQSTQGTYKDYALSTSFGFGGTNASLIFKKY